MSKGAFPRDNQLTAVAVAYRNPSHVLIADQVFPRSGVGKRDFSWTSYPKAQMFTLPDTRVGAKSKVPRIELSGEKVSSSTEDEGVEAILTQDDIANAPASVDPRAKVVEYCTNIVLLKREVRAAQLAFDAAQYDAANKVNLATANAGADQFSEPDANPITFLRAKLDNLLIRPNTIVFGQEVWNTFAMHPKVVSAALGNSGTFGVATRERIAELLEINEVLVGGGWYNTAKPGQAPNMARAWGKHCLAFFKDSSVSFASGGFTFGLTAQYGDRVAGSKEEDVGLYGGTAVRAGESVKELIIAAPAGFLFQNAID